MDNIRSTRSYRRQSTGIITSSKNSKTSY